MLGGRYQILEQIGKGGFSVTFLAQDIQRPGHPKCVVKQFKPMATDPYTLQVGKTWFDREAAVLEELGNHDQIPRLLAHFEENQEFYLVQEYIEGHDLNAELPLGTKLSETDVIQLLQDILEVLAFVHQNNAIHRDIKPSNIRRRHPDGKIVLIDFGAVKQISTQMIVAPGQPDFTIAIGTPGYMPNEQAGRNPQFSSDIYAVGMIGIQALTGMLPLQFPINFQTGAIIWRTQAQVSDELANILDTMVHPNYFHRYPSAIEASHALETISPHKSQIHKTHKIPNTTFSISPHNSSSKSQNIFLLFLGITATIALLIIGFFSKSSTLFSNQINSKIYENSLDKIKIQYPQNWELQDIRNPITGEVIAFISPRESDTDKFQDKLTISVENFTGTLEEFNNLSIKEINNQAEKSKILNTSETTLANRPGTKLIYTVKNSEKDFKSLQVFTLKDDKAYVLIYTAETKSYEKFLLAAETMMKSFEIE